MVCLRRRAGSDRCQVGQPFDAGQRTRLTVAARAPRAQHDPEKSDLMADDTSATGAESSPNPTVTLETKCWEHDWEAILKSDHLQLLADRNCHPFSSRLVMINNVAGRAEVCRWAQRAVDDGRLTGFVVVEDHADEALSFFGLTREELGRGYVYSIAELVAIYLCESEYLLHFSGDSILPAKCDWITRAVEMAIAQRRPTPGLIHHSDRGVQYACGDYQGALNDHHMIPSMSRKGDCWDNAPKESFFGTLKCELGLHGLRPSREQAHRKVFEYIEVFYNRQRLHSTLGYLSPAEFERLSGVKAA